MNPTQNTFVSILKKETKLGVDIYYKKPMKDCFPEIIPQFDEILASFLMIRVVNYKKVKFIPRVIKVPESSRFRNVC